MLYVIRDAAGHVKIGFTRSKKLLKPRIAALQTAHASQLHLLYSLPGWPIHEAKIHTLLQVHRLKGEWFDGDAVLVENVILLLKGHGPDFLLSHTAEQLRAYEPIAPWGPNWGAFPIVPEAREVRAC